MARQAVRSPASRSVRKSRAEWFAAFAAFLFLVLTVDPKGASALPPLGDHYSPAENLETIDISVLESARHTIDIAMYAFTDRNLAEALLKEARKGVKIRLYRDRTQIHDRRDQTRKFLDQPNVTLRIKGNGRRNIMHLKAYVVDGKILRTGSANWSPVGEGSFRCNQHPVGCRNGRWQQDNNLFLTDDPAPVKRFEKTFGRLWNRRTNVRDPASYVKDQSIKHSGRKRYDRFRRD